MSLLNGPEQQTLVEQTRRKLLDDLTELRNKITFYQNTSIQPEIDDLVNMCDRIVGCLERLKWLLYNF